MAMLASVNHIYSHATGEPVDLSRIDGDLYMTPEEAVTARVIDFIDSV